MSHDEYIAKTKFVARLGLSLHSCGATSHRIERLLSSVCKLLDINGEFLPSQTSFFFVFWQDDPTDQHILIKRTQPSGGNLGLLARLDTLIERFGSKQLTFSEMDDQLTKELEHPPYYKKLSEAAAWAASSFAFSTLLSNSIYDALAAGVASVVIFYLLGICGRHERFNNLSEIISSGTAGILMSIFAALGVPLNVPLCILSAIIVMVPGLSITVALSEIANRDLNSGTARFVDAVMSLIKLYLGALISIGIGSSLFKTPSMTTLYDLQHIPSWFTPIAVVILAYAITVAFNIHRKFVLWCLLSSVIAFLVSSYGNQYFGQISGVLLGAFAVGIFSNAFANYFNHPASLVLTTGIIFLVPGSKTYIILNSWVTGQQMVAHTPNAIQAFLIFISLIGGLLLASAILPTKKSL